MVPHKTGIVILTGRRMFKHFNLEFKQLEVIRGQENRMTKQVKYIAATVEKTSIGLQG